MKIKIVNNAAADAMTKAKYALSRAEAGIAMGESNLSKINDILKRAVLDFNPTPVNAGQYGAYLFKWSNSAGAVSTWGGNGLDIIFSSTKHYHTISSDGAAYAGSRTLNIKMTTGHSSGTVTAAGSISLTPVLTDIPYELTGNSEEGTLSWKIFGGGTGNFNIADTDYFKKAVAAAQEEGYKAAVDRCKIDTSTNQVSIAAGTFAEQSTTTKTASASGKTTRTDGTEETPYRIYDNTNVPATGVYTNSAGQSTGSFGYTGSYYKAARVYVRASVNWT